MGDMNHPKNHSCPPFGGQELSNRHFIFEESLITTYHMQHIMIATTRNLQSAQNTSAPLLKRPLITPREVEVLNLIAYEYSSKEIAAKLFISYETANSHRRNIISKLGVKNTAGMVRVGFELGLIRSPHLVVTRTA